MPIRGFRPAIGALDMETELLERMVVSLDYRGGLSDGDRNCFAHESAHPTGFTIFYIMSVMYVVGFGKRNLSLD